MDTGIMCGGEKENRPATLAVRIIRLGSLVYTTKHLHHFNQQAQSKHFYLQAYLNI
jgi:hypothetical protein